MTYMPIRSYISSSYHGIPRRSVNRVCQVVTGGDDGAIGKPTRPHHVHLEQKLDALVVDRGQGAAHVQDGFQGRDSSDHQLQGADDPAPFVQVEALELQLGGLKRSL